MARRRRKKFGYIKCGICRKRIPYTRGYVVVDGIEPGRIRAIRKHWSKKHPKAFRQSILRGVAKRIRRKKRLRRLK